ncbi:MAG TPA: PAS domain S-box protein, partial [Tepidisphaeraceae bacterium]
MIYLIVATVWIFCSDAFLAAVLPQATLARLSELQTFKGIFFVVATAALLYFLIRQTMSRVRSSEAQRLALLQRLELILQNMPIACMSMDREFHFTYWNPAAQRVFGFTFDEMRGKRPFETISPASRETLARDVFRRLQINPQPISSEVDNRTKDGRTIQCTWIVSPLRSAEGEFLGAISMVVDQTEQRRTRIALEESEQSLARAQSIAHLGNWELNLVTGKVAWSEEMFAIFGMPPMKEGLTVEMFEPHVHPDDRANVLRCINNCIEHGALYDVEYRVLISDGSIKHVRGQGQTTRDAAGKSILFFGTVLDITQRKQAEEKLRELNETLEQRVIQRTAQLREALEDLRTFSETVSHDLRTPLQSLARFAQELAVAASVQSDDDAAERVRRIIASTTRLDRLMSELYEYNQLVRSEIQPQRISLVLLLHELIGQLKREPQFADAEIIVREPMPWVLAHRPTLSLVLQNLLIGMLNCGDCIVTLHSEIHEGMARLCIDNSAAGNASN